MNRDKDQHVVRHGTGWAVKTPGGARASSVHSTQREAIAAARRSARRHRSELFVHRRNGTIRERDSYGDDPHPPPG